MLIPFFYTLRSAKLPVSVKEYLTLLEALKAGVVGPADDDSAAYSLDDFYYLSRTTLVKDEKHFDKFDRAFAAYFKGVDMVADFSKEIPLDWLRQMLERELTSEQKAAIEKMGWDELMETLKKRLEEQKERHEGGSKWIGTGGTSPFGHGGYNPQGVRIGGPGKNKSAVKVWEQRGYKDYDDSQELGTRNIKVALRRLRKFAREGHELELDLDDTIRSTAANAGYLDIKMIPERHNNVKVLLLMDVGGKCCTAQGNGDRNACQGCRPVKARIDPPVRPGPVGRLRRRGRPCRPRLARGPAAPARTRRGVAPRFRTGTTRLQGSP